MQRQFTPKAHPCVSAIPAFDDNYIWLIRKPGCDAVAVVDPGDPEPVEAVLREQGLHLAYILLTHHHADHVGGVNRLREQYGSFVFGPAFEQIEGISQRCADGDEIELPELSLRLQVIEVPGHTSGHIAYFGQGLGDDVRPVLFCGDTLFAGGCGRVFEGTPGQMLESLDRLAALPGQTLVYCAHEYTRSNLRFAVAVEPGNAQLQARLAEVDEQREIDEQTVPSSIAIELDTNPFLRCTEAEVVSTAASRLGTPPADPTATFTAIREWKNVFR